MKKFLLISLLFSYSTILFSQNLARYDSVAKKIVYKALTEKSGYKMLRELCTIGPRLSGSKNYYKAVKWAQEKFKEIGANNIYLQPCSVKHWERGQTESAKFKTVDGKWKSLSISALGGSIGTDGKILKNKIVMFQSFDDIKSNPERAKGKFVFFNNKFDNSKKTSGPGYGSGVKYRVNGAVEAAKSGAKAVFIRSVSSGFDNVPHTGVMHYKEGITKIPAVALGTQDANLIEELLTTNNEISMSLNLSCKNLPDTIAWNVIGEIQGSEFPNEIVAVGGHFDSWDVGQGAHDDGAPSIQTMEVLKFIKDLGIKPKRTIRTILFANEENGLAGGLRYAELADSLKEKHISALESDRGAFTPRGFSIDADSLTIMKMQAWLPILQNANIDWIRKGGSGADVGQIIDCKAKIGYVPDGQRYFDLHHSANDVFSAVNPREMELGSAAIAILTLMISEQGL